MASLAPQQLAKMRADTLSTGAALLADLRHARAVLRASALSGDDIRRLTAALQRLLIDGGLAALATPRTGRVHLDVPDNNPVYKAADKQPFLFFLSGGVEVGEATLRAVAATRGRKRHALVKNFDPERVANVRLEGFLSQRVLCLDGVWVSRGSLIEYAARLASGEPPDVTARLDFAALARARECASMKVEGDALMLKLDTDAVPGGAQEFVYDTAALDPILVEVLAACRFLAGSADIKSLESSLEAELQQPSA
ncbi:MAG TPA: hypothetical protein VFR73_18680 [Hyphomicrobiaceae bacterium]|jgi:hypothetical protein|nr:hypothetical protein [Hyphomicrobiaceae bacterium]